jgi:hypothetical protein
MEQDIRDFLKSFSREELFEWRILSRATHLLNTGSVEPLLRLMDEQGITRLTAEERRWFLTSDGDFANPRSDDIKQGRVEDLRSPGRIFWLQNKHINPYFDNSRPEPESPDEENTRREPAPAIQVTDSEQIKFGLERDLQRALRINITHLEQGLRVIDGGAEQTVKAGRIDITAEDHQGNLVVIELKSGTAQPESVAQLLGYMGAIENPDGRQVRGILVANDFHSRVVYAAKAVPNISLKAYSFQFCFEDR